MDVFLKIIEPYNLSQKERIRVLDFLQFVANNYAEYFIGETSELKSPEEIYEDYYNYCKARKNQKVLPA